MLQPWKLDAHPHYQASLALWKSIIDRLSTWQKLKEYDTECIDIDFFIQFPMHKILRS